MNGAKPIILIAVGAAVAGAVFASVPREDRAVQWPVLGMLTAGGLAIAMVLRNGSLPGPRDGMTIAPSSGGVVIPFRRPAAYAA
jgi:hypothetical protein